jgi:hypothetical protein
MRVCKADMVILELAVHDRFDSRTYDAVKKKGCDEHRYRDYAD